MALAVWRVLTEPPFYAFVFVDPWVRVKDIYILSLSECHP